MFRPEAMKVLLVDDVAANLDVLRETLQPEGYQLAVARDGATALKVAAHFAPDLILLDVMMEGMDGFEVKRRLSSQLPDQDPAVIFITARSDVTDILLGFAHGCVDYITKPFRQEEVCARVRTHLELRDANRRLVELNRQRQRWLGIVAHDLRGPLNGVAGYTDLMLAADQEMPPEERRECLELINTTVRQMVSQVNDLLDLTVIAQGRLVLQPISQALGPLIEERLKLYRLQAEMKRQRFRADLTVLPDFPFDANRITQVLDNLIGNAVKFSPSETDLEVRLRQDGAMVRVAVCDRGPGLPETELEWLIGDGVPGGTQPSAGEKCTGLGLAIARRIVEAHGGSLSARNRPGGGSCFEMALPLTGPPVDPATGFEA
jgi:signal transduction histidine kinase